MANALYVEFKNAALGAWTHSYIDLNTDDIRVALIDHAVDTPVPATDVDLTDISAGAPVAVSVQLTGPTIGVVSAGTFDHDNFVFTAVGAGAACESMTWYKHTGVAGTSPLILYIDTCTGLPVTPNGANINVTLDAAGLFGW